MHAQLEGLQREKEGLAQVGTGCSSPAAQPQLRLHSKLWERKVCVDTLACIGDLLHSYYTI